MTRSGAWLCLFALLCCAVHPARANPLEDLRNTNSLEMVMKGGRLRDADTLDEL